MKNLKLENSKKFITFKDSFEIKYHTGLKIKKKIKKRTP